MSVDMDPDALAIARENIAQVEMEDEIQLVHAQISSGAPVEKREGEVEMFCPGSLVRKFDTVIMNPPFGSWTKGIDMVFLETACQVSSIFFDKDEVVLIWFLDRLQRRLFTRCIRVVRGNLYCARLRHWGSQGRCWRR